ncbi:hypothetical protein RND71_032748 [Anisodus tanguticus]|uniref:Uncharacterized protein n=1 Tax=Anisodus tanguticus TaxID=243964 RepID=A0AAE1R6H7_9SOLA|nr:hypothetical protein RND71_032748 [Anisodus tanguticus]
MEICKFSHALLSHLASSAINGFVELKGSPIPSSRPDCTKKSGRHMRIKEMIKRKTMLPWDSNTDAGREAVAESQAVEGKT